MAYERFFDEEIARTAALACINDGITGQLPSYAVALSTTTESIDNVAPGIYRAFLGGMDPSLVVALSVASSSRAVELPAAGPPPVPSSDIVALFPGSVVERVRVIGGVQSVNVRLISGTATLYFGGSAELSTYLQK